MQPVNFQVPVFACIALIGLFTSCTDQPNVEEFIPYQKQINEVSFNELSDEIKNELNKAPSIFNDRFKGAKISETIEFDSVIIYSDSTGFRSYTVDYRDENAQDFKFYNIRFNKKDEESSTFITNYDPDINWLVEKDDPSDFSDFTGVITIYDLQKQTVQSSSYRGGFLIEHLSKNSYKNTNGKTEAICEWYQVLISCFCNHSSCSPYHGINGDCTHPDTYSQAVYVCYEDNDGGGTSGSSGTGGSYDWDYGGSGGTGGSVGTGGSGPIVNPLGEDSENIREMALNYKLSQDPFALIDIDCDEIEKWQDLAQHEASAATKNKINNLQNQNDSWFDDWAIQSLNGANGTIVNMDYFSVDVASLPNNPNTGAPFSAQGFLDYFRRNINDFVEGSSFNPYCETSTLCNQETALWYSNDPEGALIYIDIPADDGVVVCSEYSSSYWTFTTLEAPGAGNHPVSGTRQFGGEPNGNGGYSFYVRGVDRFDSNTAENTLYIGTLGINPFFGADNLWESFQNKLEEFINDNGGNALVIEPVINRPDWAKVKDVLEGNRPISDLGCN